MLSDFCKKTTALSGFEQNSQARTVAIERGAWWQVRLHIGQGRAGVVMRAATRMQVAPRWKVISIEGRNRTGSRGTLAPLITAAPYR